MFVIVAVIAILNFLQNTVKNRNEYEFDMRAEDIGGDEEAFRKRKHLENFDSESEIDDGDRDD